ncbi:MAG: 30S ribosomal protein S4e [Candidatus Nanohaloarchaea archaeon]|nr:30S ribosomal protein S4e [Candidatus Nanohaloarchaea archaeon]
MSNHQKRLSAPQNYPVERKEGAYVVTAEGPYAASEGVPLAVLLRDVLEYVDTMAEVKQVLADGRALVNQRERTEPGSNVGFMDVVSFPDLDEHYRVLVTGDGLELVPVEGDAAEQKIVRVDDKTTLNGGVTQLNLHDGNNIETDEDVPTQSSVLVSLPELAVEETVEREDGNLAYIIGGQHVGETATVRSVDVQAGSQQNTVTLESDDGEFQTVEQNVYMIGEDEPLLEVDRDE